LSGLLLNADPRQRLDQAGRRVPLRLLAILATMLLHLGVPASLLLPLLLVRHGAVPMPPSIPVTLVLEPPPAPPPPVPKPPAPQPAPRPAAPIYRESGPDSETTGAPRAEAPPSFEKPPPPPPEPEKPAEAASAEPPLETHPAEPPPVAPPAAAPSPAPVQEAVREEPPPPGPVPAPEPALVKPPAPPQATHKPAPEPPPRKPAPTPRAKPAPTASAPATTALARPEQGPPRAEGPERSGDPYFNALRDVMKKHLVYPPLARGLDLRGTAEFSVLIDRNGRLLGVHLDRSTGAELLDQAGERMIRESEPYPPPPAGYPVPFGFTISVPIAPN
jgi:TonB family protein